MARVNSSIHHRDVTNPLSKMLETIPLHQEQSPAISLANQVYEYVLKEIVFPDESDKHEIEYGGRITESSLAKELNMSNGPVREAIYRLRQEGWIRTVGNKGSFLVDFSDPEIAKDIYNFRMSFETGAFYSLATKINTVQIKTLWRILKIMEAAKQESDVSAFRKADISFHLQVVEYAGGDSFRQMFRPKLLQWYAMAYHVLTQPQEVEKYHSNYECPQPQIPSHRQLLNALEEQNSNCAAELIMAHQSYVAKLLNIDETV